MSSSLQFATSTTAPLIFAAALNITLWHVLSALGIRMMGSGQASIIAYTMPLWASMLSMIFIGEPPPLYPPCPTRAIVAEADAGPQRPRGARLTKEWKAWTWMPRALHHLRSAFCWI